jgi:hypothetical protein
MGRPRHDSVREPNGRARRAGRRARFYRDFGTAEALARRTQLVGGFPDPSDPRRECDPADKRAGYPLGILYLRGDISDAQYEEGVRYARLHLVLFGAGSTKSCLAALQVDQLGDAASEDNRPLDDATRDELMAELETELGEATAALHALPTRRPYSVLCNIVLYDRKLRFMETSRRRTPEASDADRRDLDALKLALDTLVALGQRRRRR